LEVFYINVLIMEDIMLVSIDIEHLSIFFYMISIYYNKVQIPCHTHELFDTALSRTKSKEFSFKSRFIL